MGKEVKIGLAVIGVLLCVFGGVLFVRLRGEQPDTAQQKVAAAKKEGKIKGAKKLVGKSRKTGKQTEGGPSLASGLDRFASKHPRGQRSDSAPPDDRYADRNSRSDIDWNTSGEDALSSDQTDSSQPEPPALDTSPYRNRADDDRYARYAHRDDTADAAAEDADAVQNDVAMPADRFAPQRDDGVAISEPDVGDEENTTMDTEGGAASESSVDDPADRFASDATEDERGVNELSAAADDEALRLTPLSSEEADGRYGVGANRSGPAAEEFLDGADPQPTESLGGRPRRLQPQFDGDSYTVEANDNYWRISQKVYGTGAYFKALEEHNRQELGDKPLLAVGDIVSVPPVAVLRQNYPDLSPRARGTKAERQPASIRAAAHQGRGERAYTVAEGDTLFDIARNELGKASRWAEIYALNREQLGEDFDHLAPGTQLILPAGDKVDPVAARPSRESYRR